MGDFVWGQGDGPTLAIELLSPFIFFAISVTLSLEPDQGPPRARPRLSCLLLPHEAQSILETAQAWGVAERQLRSSGAPGSWG